MTAADTIKRWRRDRMAFRREAILMEDGVTPFGEVMEPWQEEDFRQIDQHQHAYLERSRGHDKTGTAGTEAVADLFLGPRNQRIYGAAVDADQGDILFEDVAQKLKRNPLLRSSVTIKRREVEVKATGSRFEILTSDAPSAYGLRPDRVIVDELAEWKVRALWDALWSATGKRPNCRVLCISMGGWDKAGIGWEVRGIAKSEANWYFATRSGCASWISREWLEQQRRTLPAHVFARLHEARWVDGVGAFLTADEVDAVFTGFPSPLTGRAVIGLDIGLSRDRTVASVVRNFGGIVVVEELLTWAGSRGRKVDLEEVEREVKILSDRYNAIVHYDPYQGVQMAQRLQRQGVPMIEFAFTAENRRRLFSVLLDLVRSRRLRARPHEAFRHELLGLEVTETAAGWRVDHKSGKHDDHVVAAALGAQAVAGVPLEFKPENCFVGPPLIATTQQWMDGVTLTEPSVRPLEEEAGFVIEKDGPAPWDL